MKSTEATATVGQSPQEWFYSLQPGDRTGASFLRQLLRPIITQRLKQKRRHLFNSGIGFSVREL